MYTLRALLAACKRTEATIWPVWLALMLFLLVLLRIPNLFEPYWYGDEAIYLTIGTALRNGSTLYSEIVDHKTPLIYYFASTPDQLSFRLLLIGWMIMATTCFYLVVRSVFTRSLAQAVSLGLFVLATTLPFFEGHIPNGELFVIGFVLLGLALLSRTTFWQQTLHEKKLQRSFLHWTREEVVLSLLAGMAVGGAILTKVPAILDTAAITSLGLLLLIKNLTGRTAESKLDWSKLLGKILATLLIFGSGVIIPIGLSILYFVIQGAGSEYLQFGLLYNFHYSGSWQPTFDNPLIAQVFTLPGKALLLALLVAFVLALQRRVTTISQFSLIWLTTALFASLLSNRPYPHYFLQLMPPLALVIGSLLDQQTRQQRIIATAASGMLLLIVWGALLSLQVGLYSTADYYTSFWRLVSGRQSYESYRNSFNGMTADNYAAAAELASTDDRYTFIWGTNPMLYALSKKQPTGRFTVSFHIKDLNAYTETLDSLTQHAPEFIVVMRNEDTELPGLTSYLRQHYVPYRQYDHFTLWRRSILSTL